MNADASLLTSDLARLCSAVSSMAPANDDSERIDRIRLLEELKSAAAAAQAKETAAFAESQRAAQRAAGVPANQVGRGVAAQVGLAKRESPFRAQRYTGWAAILTTELPATFAALETGQITEWRAMILARETAWLSRAHRLAVDAELAPRMSTLGDRRTEAEAKRIAYRLDPYGYTERLRNAENERRVTLRPAPDSMARLSALLPLAQGVAAYAALTRAADTACSTDTACSADTACSSTGKPRSRGQLMADTLVERITGQAVASDVPVEICLVMTDSTLLRDHVPGSAQTAASANATLGHAGADEPATVLGFGPVPAAHARQLLGRASGTTPMWIRRLYRHPSTGQLAAMDTTRRTFTANQRLFLRLTGDDTCSTPWCDAPIRHADHIRPFALGGPTSLANGQGLCEACNHAKQAPGWTARRARGAPTVITRTPTGHRYLSHAPSPPGTRPPRRLGPRSLEPPSAVERRLLGLLAG